MSQYITVQGDVFDNIAKDQLGGEEYLDQLVAANPQYCGVAVFSAGAVLQIPELEEETPEDNSMPPWRAAE